MVSSFPDACISSVRHGINLPTLRNLASTSAPGKHFAQQNCHHPSKICRCKVWDKRGLTANSLASHKCFSEKGRAWPRLAPAGNGTLQRPHVPQTWACSGLCLMRKLWFSSFALALYIKCGKPMSLQVCSSQTATLDCILHSASTSPSPPKPHGPASYFNTIRLGLWPLPALSALHPLCPIGLK